LPPLAWQAAGRGTTVSCERIPAYAICVTHGNVFILPTGGVLMMVETCPAERGRSELLTVLAAAAPIRWGRAGRC
jgi:hypothetical protein